MIRRIVFVEGKSDLRFILGLLKVEELDKWECSGREGIPYRGCYYMDKERNTCICDGGGKDNVCRRVEEFLNAVKTNIEVHVLLDGDARDAECNNVNNVKMHYLKHKNLDELIFDIVQNLVTNMQCDDLTIDLLNRERSNEDSKKKAYLAMYAAWKYKGVIGLGDIKYWSTIHDFYHDIGLLISGHGNINNEVLCSERELLELLNLKCINN